MAGAVTALPKWPFAGSFHLQSASGRSKLETDEHPSRWAATVATHAFYAFLTKNRLDLKQLVCRWATAGADSWKRSGKRSKNSYTRRALKAASVARFGSGLAAVAGFCVESRTRIEFLDRNDLRMPRR